MATDPNAVFVINARARRNARQLIVYHRPSCPEVTSKRGTRAENWRPFDPTLEPMKFRRPCRRCLPYG